jgi:hypothetical protein
VRYPNAPIAACSIIISIHNNTNKQTNVSNIQYQTEKTTRNYSKCSKICQLQDCPSTGKEIYQFKYLGRLITNNENDLPAVKRQITKAQATWGRIGKIIHKNQKQTQKC